MTDGSADFWEFAARYAPPEPPRAAWSSLGPGLPSNDWAAAAVEGETIRLLGTPEGARNDTLNYCAWRLARVCRDNGGDPAAIRRMLYDAAVSIGLSAIETRATIESGWSTGWASGDRALPVARRDLTPAHTIDPNDPNNRLVDNSAIVAETPTNGLAINGSPLIEGSRNGHPKDCSEESGEAAADPWGILVEQRALQMWVGERAKERVRFWRAAELGQDAPPVRPLTEVLAEPDEDATYRVGELLPTGGRALLAAQHKAGKTSLVANLIRALAGGGMFLGRFAAQPARVALLDTELDERMLRRWLREQAIIPAEGVSVVSLRGRVSTLDILEPAGRARWAERLRDVDVLILDCLRPCLDALGLAEKDEAGRFLVAWDALTRECGASESVVVHHMGHTGERSRGDSRLLDWPDVNWRIIKESQDEERDPAELDAGGGRRFFSAHGRDVAVPEGELRWDPLTRGLTYLDGGRGDARAAGAESMIVDVLNEPANSAGMGTVALTNALGVLGVGKPTARRAIKRAIAAWVVLEAPGPHGGKVLSLNPSNKVQ